MNTLWILRGLPGSGKSTVAEELAETFNAAAGDVCPYSEVTIVAADDFHMVDGVYDWKPENVFRAHRKCQYAVASAMHHRHPTVIVHNTFTTEKEMRPYLDLAKIHDYRVFSMIVENRHGGKNIHNVPEENLQLMERRLRDNLQLI